MDVADVRDLALQHLQRTELPLQLTFYGNALRSADGFVIIGDDYGTEIRVRLSDGVVLSIDPQGELPTRFINSSIGHLAKFIDVFQSYAKSNDPPTQLIDIARQMRCDFERIDAIAVSNPENWWVIILEQIETGML